MTPGAQKKASGAAPKKPANQSLTVARRLAQSILTRVAEQGAHASPLLNASIGRQQLPPPEAAFLTELVYGTLRHQGQLELRLQRHLHAPLARLPQPVQCALRAGAYQLLYMRVPAYTAVDATVEVLRRRFGRLAGVANAVLRRLADEQARQAAQQAEAADAADATAPLRGPLAQTASEPAAPDAPVDAAALAEHTSHPAWLVARWLDTFGPRETQALLAANNVRPPLSLRVNTRRCSPADLLARLTAAGLSPTVSPALAEGILLPRSGDVRRLPGYVEGHFVVQDMAPALVAHLLAPPPGSCVIDLCAAPGGKSTHLAELLRGTGRVLAVDSHPGRLGLVVKNATRLGHGNVVPVLADATDAAILGQALGDAGVHGPVDHVLVDPPCSGSGTLRRHPELRQRDDATLASLCAQQACLLQNAADLVAPGGTLVYAVCSLLAEEGPQQVTTFLARNPAFVVDALPEELRPWQEGVYLQTSPHRHQLDGFFAARLRRRDDTAAA